MGKINVRGKNPSEWKISENMVQGLSGAGCVGSKQCQDTGDRNWGQWLVSESSN